MQDLRHAVRLLLRSPGHTLTALLALALGLGATIAIFSAVYAVLFRPLQIPEASQVVVPVSVNPARGFDRASIPYADYLDWRGASDVFTAVAAYQPTAVDLAGDGTPERVQTAIVTEEYFAVLRAQPLRGRVLQPADHAADAPRTAVLSDALWQRRFGSDPSLVGREIRLAGNVVTVAGIVEAARMWPVETDVWLPLKPSTLPADVLTRRDNMIFLGLARLQASASIEQARARVRAVAGRIAADHPESRTGWSTNLLPLRDSLIEPEIRLALLALLGGAGFVLVIACVNLANLLLARGADRAREIAVRAAMGATRRRLLRQLVTENALLAGIGGAAGLLLARWLAAIISAAGADVVPMSDTIRVDGAVTLVSVALTAGTMVLFGLAPALSTSASGSFGLLREGRGVAGGGRAQRLRETLVVVQIALAIVLLTGAGLMLRSFARILQVDPGVDVDQVLTGRITLPASRYPNADARARFYERVIADITTLPGVESAAAASYVPAGGRGFGLGRVFLLHGQPEPPASADHPASWNVVTPDYFRTMGIRLLAGRGFTTGDSATSTPIMIINRTMARRVFGDRNPLGARMRSWRDENLLREIVGVVSDVRYEGLTDEDRSLVYVPHAQNSWGSLTLVVRATDDPARVAAPVRQMVARHDPDLAVADVAPLRTAAARSIAAPRFGAWLFSLFAAAAAILAALGIYGVMSYAVARRSHEIAVRLALGAAPASVSRLVIARGLLLTGVGAAIGIGVALAAGRFMDGILFGVRPDDPLTVAIVPLLLSGIALLACALPARRAARVEPLAALRAD